MSRSASRTQAALIGGAVALGLLLSGCTSTRRTSGEPRVRRRSPAPSEPRPHRPTRHPQSRPARRRLNPDYALTINIAIANGKTIPNGEKINVRVGQKVILNVTSDTDDEVHAHIGGAGL